MKKWVDDHLEDMTPEEEKAYIEIMGETVKPPVTVESLDHRLSDVEYIITGEVATNAQ